MTPFTATLGSQHFYGFIEHENDMPAYVLSSPVPGMGGWGNGYVAVPLGHPAHGMDYDAASDKFSIEINGGLTYARLASAEAEIPVPADSWVFGFDTLHYGDTSENWPDAQSVMAETLRLREQLARVADRRIPFPEVPHP